MNIQLCTTGPHYDKVAEIALAAGVDPSPIKFVRQQDIVDDEGKQAFPRVWTGKSHLGTTVSETYNGGWPGRENPYKLADALNKHTDYGRQECIFDLEPENWQVLLSKGTIRQVTDALDVLEGCGTHAQAIAFTFYNNMYSLVSHNIQWLRDMPLITPDAYVFDHPSKPPTPEKEYREAQELWVSTYGDGVPSRRIRPFFWMGSSGEDRALTLPELRFCGKCYRDMNIHNGLLWMGCDRPEDVEFAKKYLTKGRVDALRGA